MNKLKFFVRALLLLPALVLLLTIGPDFQESYLYRNVGESVVKITKGRSGGTGWQVETEDGDRYVITNKHICRMGKMLTAQNHEGKRFLLKRIKMSAKHDLCALEPVPDLSPLKLAGSTSKHSKVYLVGHPGLRPLTIESGRIVGEMDVNITSQCSKKEFSEFMQRECSPSVKNGNTLKSIKCLMWEYQALLSKKRYCINNIITTHINITAYGGNSGSPIVNTWGNVVGVLFAGSRSQSKATYMVPHRFLKQFVESL